MSLRKADVWMVMVMTRYRIVTQEPIPDKTLTLLNIVIWLVGAVLAATFSGQLGPFKVQPTLTSLLKKIY